MHACRKSSSFTFFFTLLFLFYPSFMETDFGSIWRLFNTYFSFDEHDSKNGWPFIEIDFNCWEDLPIRVLITCDPQMGFDLWVSLNKLIAYLQKEFVLCFFLPSSFFFIPLLWRLISFQFDLKTFQHIF